MAGDYASGRWDEFRSGWPVLVASVLGVMVSVSVAPIYAIGAFVKPLQLEFGWSRGAIQYALTAYFVGAICGAALCGWLLRRFAVRAVAIASLFGNALGFVLMSRLNSSIWSLYVGLFALIILGAGTMSATWTGSYSGLLWTCGGFFLTGSLLLLTLGKYPSFG